MESYRKLYFGVAILQVTCYLASAGCGRVFNNTVLSPGYPNNYPNNVDCVYSVHIPPGMAMKIFFNYFSLVGDSDCRYDYLAIKNDNNQDFGKYCGHRSGKSIKVTGRYVNVSFHSDRVVNTRGYNLSFSAVPLGQFVKASLENTTGCGRVSNNILLSPGYPNNYPHNMDCVYSVNIPHGMAMKIFFNYFDLEEESLCGFDFLSIENNQDFGKYCGIRSGESVIVTGRYVNISFHSDVTDNGRGYNVSFSAVPPVGCGRVSNNTLLSPGYPNNYARYMDCTYSVDILPGMAIKIFFNYFELEDRPSCRYHYLSIKNGNNKDFGKYCGVRSGESVIVTGRYVKISFHSDGGSNNRRGYNVSFSVFPSVGYCSDLDLGMQSGSIPDNRITASSQLNSNTPAKNGRLNYAAGSSWCASTNDSNPYLQIDLQTLHIICAVSTQGNAKADEWVEKYTLQTSRDGKNWSDYKNGEQVEVLRGNVDSNTVNKNFIYLGVLTRWMRFWGTARHVAFCMRVEVFGVKQKPENVAAGKVTEQSSTYSNSYINSIAAKAVDGNSNPDFNNGHCSRTLEDSPSWWRVDLGDRVPVFEVRIVNRLVWSSTGSSDLRNRDYKITLGNSPNVTANTECVGRYSFADFIASAVCYSKRGFLTYGRYVGIMTMRKQFLQLCEVEIYSRDNMAFNKAAEQSSTAGGVSAIRAVDGNFDTDSKTWYDNPAWWRVDLGREEHVSAVYIVGFVPGSFDIRVGSVPNVLSGPLCATIRSVSSVVVQTFFCRPTLYGKYVTIIVMERWFLVLYEVEVYSARRASQIQEVGVTSWSEIPSSSFTASSARPGNEPDQARLNFRHWYTPNRAWLPSTNSNPSDYLQIHLEYVFFICAVATQGNPNADEWTTKYKLLLSLDETTWITYKENGKEKIFNGNNGRNDVVKHNLVEAARASIVRFQPTEFRSHKALRVELYGTMVPTVPYDIPNNLSLTAQTSTSVIASWQLPSKRKITGYKLLSRKQGSQDSLTTLTTSSSTRATVAKLIKYTKYEFQVLAFNHFGDGPKSSFKVVRTKEDVPSEAPRNLTATARSSTSVIATWQLPATDSRNGIIKGFKLFYKTKGSDIKSTTTFLFESANILTKTVSGLDEFTEYEFQVLAFTSVGDGPKSAVITVRTKEDGY